MHVLMIIHEKIFVIAAVFKGEPTVENFLFQRIYDVTDQMTRSNDKISFFIDKLREVQPFVNDENFGDQWSKLCNDCGIKDIYSEKFDIVTKEIDKLK